MARLENAILQIGLRTAVYIPRGQATHRALLDGVVAGKLFERHNDGPGAFDAMTTMIAHWNPAPGIAIPQASQAILEMPATGIERVAVPFTQDIFRTIEDAEMRGRITGVNWQNSDTTIRRNYKYKFPANMYDALNVATVWYLFRGDVSRVVNTLRLTHRFGALRAKGGAEIDFVEAEIVRGRSPMFGITGGGRLLRPVPARCERELKRMGPVAYHNGMVENWHGPYHWSENKELCLVPVQTGNEMIMFRDDLVELTI